SSRSPPQRAASSPSRAAGGSSSEAWKIAFTSAQRSASIVRASTPLGHRVVAFGSSASTPLGRRSAAQLDDHPGAGERPFALDGGGRDAQRLRRLLDRQAGEEAQLDEARLLGVDLLQAA